MSEMHSVDLCFPVTGEKIPVDSGYWLYSALCKAMDSIHLPPEVGVFPIKGFPERNRTLTLTPQSQLALRLPQSQIGHYLSLAGQKLQIGEGNVVLKGGYLRPLTPAPRLYSRLVIIKGYTEAEAFVWAAQKQLTELDIKGQALLVPQPEIADSNVGKESGSHSLFLRRTLRIKDKNIVGFALRVQDLSPEESMLLQEKGLGGRRHFGCGLFLPDKR